jgi:hypothetical protein
LTNTNTFERETKYKIGDVTYIVSAHFDDKHETVTDKIKRLLRQRVEGGLLRTK